jgi:predicted signal transduction protein with EAL and GGDEF domain
MLDAMLAAPRRGLILLIVASFGGCDAARACGIGTNTLAAPLLARLSVEFPGALVAGMEEDRFVVAVPAAADDLPALPGIVETLSEPLDLGRRRIHLKVSLGCLLADIAVTTGAEGLARCESARAAAARDARPALVFYGDPAEGSLIGRTDLRSPVEKDARGAATPREGLRNADRR